MALRSHVDPHSVVKQLKGMRCPSPSLLPKKNGKVLSCSDALAKVLERFLDNFEAQRGQTNSETLTEEGKVPQKEHSHKPAYIGHTKTIAGICPDCGGILEHESGCFESGCFVCHSCGFSKC
jgi:ribonucleoside-diphosphate reductase alpha chain